MTNIQLAGIDHVAITVRDIEATCAFFDRLFGIHILSDHRRDGETIIKVIVIGGSVRLSVHHAGNGVDLVAARPTIGSADLCFRWTGSIEEAAARLHSNAVAIVAGPEPRITIDGLPSASVYFRDPDGNLLELMAGSF